MKTLRARLAASLSLLWRHLWLDERDARRRLGQGGLDRLEAAVSASESAHSGQICLCVEASLPPRQLWQALRGTAIDTIVDERALSVFTRLRVWDTEHNNGVLIYVLLAERRLVLTADRALARQLSPAQWQALTEKLSPLLHEALEAGMLAAVDAMHSLLVDHFALAPSDFPARENPLPDRPHLI